jgi:hypothetical protein
MDGDLISRSKLMAEMGAACVLDVDAGIPGGEDCTPRKLIDAAPAEDAEIVRHGRWHRDSSLTNY